MQNRLTPQQQARLLDRPESCTRSASRTSTPRATRSAFASRARSTTRRRDRDVPRREPVRLEDDDVVVGLAARELAGDDLLQLVHLEPVEDAGLDRLDQVGRLEPRVLDRVAADERRALEHDVVELAAPAVVRADGAHERARPAATRRAAPDRASR